MGQGTERELSPEQVLNTFTGNEGISWASVTSRLLRVGFAPNDRLISQGEASNAMYFITKGIVRITHKLPGQEEKSIAELSAGTVVGEMGILDDMPRMATVVAQTDVVAQRLSREDWLDIKKENQPLAARIEEIARQRQAEDRLLLQG